MKLLLQTFLVVARMKYRRRKDGAEFTIERLQTLVKYCTRNIDNTGYERGGCIQVGSLEEHLT